MRARIPGARIDFQPDPDLQVLLDRFMKPIDDRMARQEWNWSPTWTLERMVDDMLQVTAAG